MTKELNLDNFQQSMVVSLTLVGAMFGAACMYSTHSITDSHGRHTELLWQADYSPTDIHTVRHRLTGGITDIHL